MAKTRTRTVSQNTGEEGTTETNENSLVMLKLVGAETYHCHRVRDDVIRRGEIIEVAPDVADLLLDDVYKDALNNEHPVFVETSAEEEEAAKKRAARKVAKQQEDTGDDSE